MNETINKELTISESDPQSLDEHRDHEPGSFMDVYRSLSIDKVELDSELVDKCVKLGVIPVSIRYGSMNRVNMAKAQRRVMHHGEELMVIRGVVKSNTGELHYFNWHPEAEFKLIKADDKTKLWDAQRLYDACSHGCDMRKAGEPLDPGEPVARDAENEVEEDDDAEKARPAAVASISEEQSIREQNSLLTDRHPGAAIGHTPDDPTRGRQWHAEKALSKPGDGTAPLASNDGVSHWSATDLMKAWGKKLQQTAPRAQPKITALEAQYLTEVMGVSQQEISKGVQIPPRHRMSFEQWKSSRLQGRLSDLRNWLKEHGE